MNLPGTHDKGKQPLRCPALEKAFLCPAQEHSEHARSLEPRGGPQLPPNGEGGAARTAPCPGTSQSPQWDRQPCLWGHSRDVWGGDQQHPAPHSTRGAVPGGFPSQSPHFPGEQPGAALPAATRSRREPFVWARPAEDKGAAAPFPVLWRACTHRAAAAPGPCPAGTAPRQPPAPLRDPESRRGSPG